MLTDAYRILDLTYKFPLTLSLTEVACQHTFSNQKIIKSRLRSSHTSDKLEAFMLMTTEKDFLITLNSHTVIDRLAGKNKVAEKKLLF